MASIEELKRHPRIDLHDLADRLGIKRGAGGDKALYHSPRSKDTNPSLSIFVDDPTHGTGWRDWSGDAGGSNIDLVMYVLGCDVSGAMRYLHQEYGIAFDKPAAKEESRPKSKIDYITDRCLAAKEQVREYLESRGISDKAIKAALQARTVGFSDWTSPRVPAGEVGYGGPAAAFLVRPIGSVHIVGVDMRFLDPELNGKVKTQSHGEKEGYGWTTNERKPVSYTHLTLPTKA